MSNIIIQGNEINAKEYVDKVVIEGIGEEKTLNPRMIVAKGGNMIEYSTEERMIGIWTDGKPLYHKTLYYTSGGGVDDTDKIIDTSINTINNSIVKIEGVAAFGYGTGGMYNNTEPLTTGQLHLHRQYGAGVTTNTPYIHVDDLGVHFHKNGNSDHAKSILITLQYTKTTD